MNPAGGSTPNLSTLQSQLPDNSSVEKQQSTDSGSLKKLLPDGASDSSAPEPKAINVTDRDIASLPEDTVIPEVRSRPEGAPIAKPEESLSASESSVHVTFADTSPEAAPSGSEVTSTAKTEEPQGSPEKPEAGGEKVSSNELVELTLDSEPEVKEDRKDSSLFSCCGIRKRSAKPHPEKGSK